MIQHAATSRPIFASQTLIFHALSHSKGAKREEVARPLIEKGGDATIRARGPGHTSVPAKRDRVRRDVSVASAKGLEGPLQAVAALFRSRAFKIGAQAAWDGED
jgi:hypothetical protein